MGAGDQGRIQTCLGSLQEEMMSTRLLFFSVVGMYFIFWNFLTLFDVMVDDDRESYRASSPLSDPNRLPAPIFGVSHAKKGVLPSLGRREIIGGRRRRGIV